LGSTKGGNRTATHDSVSGVTGGGGGMGGDALKKSIDSKEGGTRGGRIVKGGVGMRATLDKGAKRRQEEKDHAAVVP